MKNILPIGYSASNSNVVNRRKSSLIAITISLALGDWAWNVEHNRIFIKLGLYNGKII